MPIAITPFYQLYQEVKDIYQDEAVTVPTEIWHKIATVLNAKQNVLVDLFRTLRSDSSVTEFKLNYDLELAQLTKQIGTETADMVKNCLILTYFHKVVYQLMSTEGNYRYSLNGQHEMHIVKEPVDYYVSISVKTEQNIYFHAFILIFGLESVFNRHFYVGIDFEYTNKKIQLAQLNFEHNLSVHNMIQLVSPNELEPVMMENFINLIMCNRFIKKILHGADSLDIFYVYDHMLAADPGRIIKFTRAFIDTRFLCEYYKLSRDEESDNKCAIYDEDPKRSAINYFGVVNEEQQARLSQLLSEMPAPFDIQWNIHKLNEKQLHYAVYDVVFLKNFYYRIMYMGTLDEDTDEGKKTVLHLYEYILYELTQFVYLEKRGITLLLVKCKEEIDLINNYMIRNINPKHGIMKLIDVYKAVVNGLTIAKPKVDFDKVMKVNYFKNPMITIIKKMTYSIISHKYTVYKDKTSRWTDKLSNQIIYDLLKTKELHFLNLVEVLQELEKVLQEKITSLLR